jgi:hypothetical protein
MSVEEMITPGQAGGRPWKVADTCTLLTTPNPSQLRARAKDHSLNACMEGSLSDKALRTVFLGE